MVDHNKDEVVMARRLSDGSIDSVAGVVRLVTDRVTGQVVDRVEGDPPKGSDAAKADTVQVEAIEAAASDLESQAGGAEKNVRRTERVHV